jgi:hypothetical protein
VGWLLYEWISLEDLELQTGIRRRTVGNGPVVSRFIEAVRCEGVGNASKLRLDQSIGYGIVETLEEST